MVNFRDRILRNGWYSSTKGRKTFLEGSIIPAFGSRRDIHVTCIAWNQKFLDKTWQPCPLQNALVLLQPVPLEGPNPIPVPTPSPLPILNDVPERDGDEQPQGEAPESRQGQQRTLRDVCLALYRTYKVVSRIRTGNAACHFKAIFLLKSCWHSDLLPNKSKHGCCVMELY